MNNQQSAKVGGWLDSLIQAGTTIFASTQQPSGGGGNPMSITTAIDQLVIQLNQLETQFAALNPTERLQLGAQAISAAQQIITGLGTLTGRGTDAVYLSNARTIANAVLTHIQEMIREAQAVIGNPTNPPSNTPPVSTNPPTTTPTATNQTPITLPDGQIIYVASPSQAVNNSGQILNGVDNIYLIGGVAVLAVLLLKK